VDDAGQAAKQCQDDVKDEVKTQSRAQIGTDRGQEDATKQSDNTHHVAPCDISIVTVIIPYQIHFLIGMEKKSSPREQPRYISDHFYLIFSCYTCMPASFGVSTF
jgi:hypothetical protein